MAKNKTEYNWKLNLLGYICLIIPLIFLLINAIVTIIIGPMFFLVSIIINVMSIRSYFKQRKEAEPTGWATALMIANIIVIVIAALALFVSTVALFKFILFPPQYAPLM